jgi:tRNA A37 threonylcarbamoyladenosine dehydratase
MEKPFDRTEMLLGKEGMERLRRARVILFGVGGVGGYAAEALVRSGIGKLTVVDHDRISPTNLNRQIIALHSTIGRYKVDVMKERAADISPETDVEARRCFFLPENQEEFDFSAYDYVIDAVDTVSAKLSIIEKAKREGVPVISSMGAGNKLDPSAFRVADISETSVCPLARVMRRELRKRGIEKVKVVYSREIPASVEDGFTETGKAVPGSIAFVPSAAGLILAGEVIRDLAGTGKTG